VGIREYINKLNNFYIQVRPKERRKSYLRYLWLNLNKTKTGINHLKNSISTTTTCCIITGLFISLKKHCENVSEKEPIFADEGATVRALLKNKNAEKYV
jgi:hypothetical protein